MRNKQTSKFSLYRVGQWIAWIAAGMAVVLGLLADVEPQRPPFNTWPEMVLSTIKFLNDWSLVLYVIIPLLFVFAWSLRCTGDPWVWEKIQYLVNGIDEKVFQDLTRDRENRHRVTLFQRKQFVLFVRRPGSSWFWPYGEKGHPWSGWLVPVLRSGHTAQNTRSIFYAPRGKNSHKVEGVVGQAWAEQRTIIVDKLPDIQQNNPETMKEEYAKKTWCDVNLVDRYTDREQPPPRSIGAVPIEVRGKPWGALVFDSKALEGITNRKAKQYTLTVSLIGHLLEKA